MEQIFKFIINEIINYKYKKPIIFGINGVDTSGKTEFTNRLNEYLMQNKYKTCLIHLDDFHNELKIRKLGKNEIDAYINNAFNLKLLENELLKNIKNEGNLNKELILLNLDTNLFENHKKYYCDENYIILFEGTLLFRNPIEKYLDYKIFLDISFDEVIERAKKRDIPKYGESFLDKYINKYIPIQKWYIENCSPYIKSNLIIDNNDYRNPKILKK